MGWLFKCDPHYGKKELVADLRKPSRFSEGYTLVKASTVGNHHWYLLKSADGNHIIGLDLLQGGGRNQGWGYKDMDESCGPCYYDCPISYLDYPAEPKGYAVGFREKVRAHHAKKTARPAYAEGQVWQVWSGRQYRLDKPLGRRGWRVVEEATGCVYRMPFKHLAAATITQGVCHA